MRILLRIALLLVAYALACRAFSPSTTSPRRRRRHPGVAATTTRLTATSVTKQNCDVCVMGGGFGGLYTALSIASQTSSQRTRKRDRRPLDIVLVDDSDRFVFLPLLYDLVEGTATRREVCPPYREILQGTGIRLVQGTLRDVVETTGNAGDGMTAKVSDATDPSNAWEISFGHGVLAVGATPQSILSKVPGASRYAQPFYSQEHALQTRDLLRGLERRREDDEPLRLAVVGGGYGGVELAACLRRRRFGGERRARVTLLARSPPLRGTRAESVVRRALRRLGVRVELCRVDAVVRVDDDDDDDPSVPPRVRVRRTRTDTDTDVAAAADDDGQIWDAVFWTAGSGPAEPVSDTEALVDLERVEGRLATDRTLRCYGRNRSKGRQQQPPLWALGDCATVVGGDPIPKTAQAAMQQADVVAHNILLEYEKTASRSGITTTTTRNSGSSSRRMTRNTPQKFAYQDLGSMMKLGGPNGVIAAPPDSTTFGPLFAPLIDTARFGLDAADAALRQQQQSSSPLAGLSLGGHGLMGVDDDDDDDDASRGSLAGALAGATRRAVYAARMPTNRQRVYSVTSAALSTALALAREAAVVAADSDAQQQTEEDKASDGQRTK